MLQRGGGGGGGEKEKEKKGKAAAAAAATGGGGVSAGREDKDARCVIAPPALLRLLRRYTEPDAQLPVRLHQRIKF